MRYEFAKLHEDLATTMIYVTHDQVEAMTLADRIVVLSAGRVEQVGTPLEVYEFPRNAFVAGFIGSPKMNFIEAEVTEAGAPAVTVRLKSGDKVTLGVRPEHLRVGGEGNVIDATITFVEMLGANTQAYCAYPGVQESLTCQLAGDATVREGDMLRMSVPADCSHLFDASGQAFKRHYRMPARRAA